MAELLCISQPVYSRIEAGKKPLSLRALQRVADRSGLSIQTLIFAHLLLDEHLESLKGQRADPATKALLQIADAFRQRYPSQLRDAAALGLLFESASD
jgi:transcriptional regulator with XRE-family HTH domain